VLAPSSVAVEERLEGVEEWEVVAGRNFQTHFAGAFDQSQSLVAAVVAGSQLAGTGEVGIEGSRSAEAGRPARIRWSGSAAEMRTRSAGAEERVGARS